MKMLLAISRVVIFTRVTGNSEHHLYRRSANHVGMLAAMQMRNGDIDLNNQWPAPYSHLLSIQYKVQKKVKYCNSVCSIKYICK